MTLFFADVRNSTALAEKMNAIKFSDLMNRFYLLETDVLVRKDAFIDKLVGDEVIGLFFLGLQVRSTRIGLSSMQSVC